MYDNSDRARWGSLACASGTPDADVNDLRTNLVDTLANIQHHAGRIGVDFDDALRMATTHYEEEVLEELDPENEED